MKNNFFNKIVKILSKKYNKTINITDLKKIFYTLWETNNKKIYKQIYRLKHKGYLISLRKDLFFVKKPDQQIDLDWLIENLYWQLLKKKINNDLPTKNRYIWGLKALEINIWNYNIPDNILIINDKKDSLEKIAWDKKVIFTTYKAWSKDYIKIVKKFLQKIKIGKYTFPYSNLELAILESLYNPNELEKNYIYELIKKILRKKWKKLNFEIFEVLLKNNKFHTSINRLYKLAKLTNPKVAENLKNIIKKYSYFLEID